MKRAKNAKLKDEIWLNKKYHQEWILRIFFGTEVEQQSNCKKNQKTREKFLNTCENTTKKQLYQVK